MTLKIHRSSRLICLVESGLRIDFVNFSKRRNVSGSPDIESKVEFLEKRVRIHAQMRSVLSSTRSTSC